MRTKSLKMVFEFKIIVRGSEFSKLALPLLRRIPNCVQYVRLVVGRTLKCVLYENSDSYKKHRTTCTKYKNIINKIPFHL